MPEMHRFRLTDPVLGIVVGEFWSHSASMAVDIADQRRGNRNVGFLVADHEMVCHDGTKLPTAYVIEDFGPVDAVAVPIRPKRLYAVRILPGSAAGELLHQFDAPIC